MKNLKNLFTALLLLCAVTVSAHNFEVDGIYYNITSVANKTVEVTFKGNYSDSYTNEYSGDIVIPETVTYGNVTCSVTTIGDFAFCFCTALRSIEIPNSVTSIGSSAFSGCDGLTSIEIPNSVTTIGDGAFQFCDGLTSIVIPNSVTSIGDFAFRDCDGLTSVTIGSGVTNITYSAFYGCDALTSIVVDSDNRAYDSRENCNAIIETATNTLIAGCMNTVIPNSVTTIGYDAFSGCSGLTSIVIPNSVTSIGDCAFDGCTGLTSIEIPNSVTSIGDYAFYDCDGLTSIEIPNSVTSIGSQAFYGTAWYNNQPDGVVYAGKVLYKYKGTMPENTSIIIKDGTLGIAGGAFYDCSWLSSIEIPNSVTSIGDDAFYNCDGLTSIEIPNSVTTIEYDAFYSCSGLTNVTIGRGVTSIGTSAFEDCFRLTNITSLIPAENLFVPGSNAFYRVDKAKCTLYVPYGARETYATTDGWRDFENIVELEETNGIEGVAVEKTAPEAVYDLNGRRVENPASGIYIIGGKKVLVK